MIAGKLNATIECNPLLGQVSGAGPEGGQRRDRAQVGALRGRRFFPENAEDVAQPQILRLWDT